MGKSFAITSSRMHCGPRIGFPGFEERNTGVDVATGSLAGVRVVKPLVGATEKITSTHNSDILFGFVLSGEMNLGVNNMQTLTAGTAFTVPPEMAYTIDKVSEDLEWLEVTLPGAFNTEIVQ